MAASASFLASCRTLVSASAEWAAFQSALLALERADGGQALARWRDCYDDGKAATPGARCPATALRQFIRAAVKNVEVSAGELSQPDREGAYQQLAAEYAPERARPPLPNEDIDNLRALALANLAGVLD